MKICYSYLHQIMSILEERKREGLASVTTHMGGQGVEEQLLLLFCQFFRPKGTVSRDFLPLIFRFIHFIWRPLIHLLSIFELGSEFAEMFVILENVFTLKKSGPFKPGKIFIKWNLPTTITGSILWDWDGLLDRMFWWDEPFQVFKTINC